MVIEASAGVITRWTVALPAWAVVVEVSASGFEIWATAVEVSAGEDNAQAARLEAAAVGPVISRSPYPSDLHW